MQEVRNGIAQVIGMSTSQCTVDVVATENWQKYVHGEL
jgi:hypothetical protein